MNLGLSKTDFVNSKLTEKNQPQSDNNESPISFEQIIDEEQHSTLHFSGEAIPNKKQATTATLDNPLNSTDYDDTAISKQLDVDHIVLTIKSSPTQANIPAYQPANGFSLQANIPAYEPANGLSLQAKMLSLAEEKTLNNSTNFSTDVVKNLAQPALKSINQLPLATTTDGQTDGRIASAIKNTKQVKDELFSTTAQINLNKLKLDGLEADSKLFISSSSRHLAEYANELSPLNANYKPLLTESQIFTIDNKQFFPANVMAELPQIQYTQAIETFTQIDNKQFFPPSVIAELPQIQSAQAIEASALIKEISLSAAGTGTVVTSGTSATEKSSDFSYHNRMSFTSNIDLTRPTQITSFITNSGFSELKVQNSALGEIHFTISGKQAEHLGIFAMQASSTMLISQQLAELKSDLDNEGFTDVELFDSEEEQEQRKQEYLAQTNFARSNEASNEDEVDALNQDVSAAPMQNGARLNITV